SEFAQLRDTSFNLKQLLDFNSEFSNSFTRGRLQNKTVDIKLQSQYFIQVANNAPLEGLPFISSLFTYNQEKANGVNVYPVVESKEFHALQAIDIDSLSNAEQFVIQQVMEEAKQSNYNNALEILRNSLEKFTTQWLYYFIEGTIEASMTEYIHSMAEITNAVKLVEGGNKYGSDGGNLSLIDYSRAERGFTNSIEVNPNFSLSWYNRANVLVQGQRYREAIDDYSKAISIDENLPQAYFNRGLTLIFMKELERGCLDISKAGQLGIVDAYNVIKRYCEKKKP
ncbi:MAG: tetratricopeptide repeat protein, partial [Salinivirgaceae bacterium]|nr:tetratricopeptide repeat protein [Salinivirgaceae bacterium]